VGDEVTDFFIVMTVLFVGWLAWCSTRIADQPVIRTVLILRDRMPVRVTSISSRNSRTVSDMLQELEQQRSSESSTEEETLETTSNSDAVRSSCPTAAAVDTNESPPEVSRSTESTRTAEQVLIETMDSFSDADRSLLQRTVKADNSDALDQTTSSASECTSEEPIISDSNTDITIKLKFMNDDQKVVTGSLKEMLGDFKRRHFQMELEARKAVRLVFNGRVLQPDTQTLEQCGLFNDCVVHCWVHQPRPSAAVPSSTLDNSSSIYFNSQPFSDLPTGAGISSIHNDWDLSRLLVSLLTIILGLAWYSRYHYAQLFTATTTLALYALTAIFAVSLFSNFFPDPDNIRNVE